MSGCALNNWVCLKKTIMRCHQFIMNSIIMTIMKPQNYPISSLESASLKNLEEWLLVLHCHGNLSHTIKAKGGIGKETEKH